LKNYADVIADCSEVLSRVPDNLKVLYRRALANKALSHFALAHEDIRRMLQIEPTNSIAITLDQKLQEILATPSPPAPQMEDRAETISLLEEEKRSLIAEKVVPFTHDQLTNEPQDELSLAHLALQQEYSSFKHQILIEKQDWTFQLQSLSSEKVVIILRSLLNGFRMGRSNL
jgi:hypothetical protein